MATPFDILDAYRNRRKMQKGFTLVELLVVIAIIGVLATLVLIQLGTARARARDAKRIADVNQMRQAMELYYDQGGVYPTAAEVYPGSGTDSALKSYVATLPFDPLSTTTPYGVCVNADKTSFLIWTNLEQKNDGAIRGRTAIDASGFGCATTGARSPAAVDTTDANTGACGGGTGTVVTRTDCVYAQGTQ